MWFPLNNYPLARHKLNSQRFFMSFQSTQYWLRIFSGAAQSPYRLLMAELRSFCIFFPSASSGSSSWTGGYCWQCFLGLGVCSFGLSSPSSLFWSHAVFLHEQSFSEKPSPFASSDLFSLINDISVLRTHMFSSSLRKTVLIKIMLSLRWTRHKWVAEEW